MKLQPSLGRSVPPPDIREALEMRNRRKEFKFITLQVHAGTGKNESRTGRPS